MNEWTGKSHNQKRQEWETKFSAAEGGIKKVRQREGKLKLKAKGKSDCWSARRKERKSMRQHFRVGRPHKR